MGENSNMIKRCIVCGKSFTPVANHSSVQILCSEECRKIRQKERHDTEEFRKKCRDRCRAKAITLCTLCGKPIERNYSSGHKENCRMHDKCVFEDCKNAILSGEKLTRAQSERLYRRGYTVKEFKVEISEETQE